MSWFFVDDHLHDHRKPRKAGLEAMGLWTLAGSWCADNLTDGFVPRDVALRWAARRLDRLAGQLVDADLWSAIEQDGEEGWLFHDWAGWQRTREQVEALRAKRSASGALGGRKSGHTRSKTEASAKASASPSAQATGKQKRTPRADAPPALPIPSTELANASSAAVADTSPPAAPDGAQALIAEWIDHCNGGRPPGRVIGQVAKELGLMLAEGIPTADVRAGLATWHGLGLHPSALASVVHEARTSADRQRRTPDRPNSAENRLAKSADIAAQLRAERDQPLAIGDHLDLTEIGNLP